MLKVLKTNERQNKRKGIMRGKRKRGRPRTRGRDEVEKDLNIKGMRKQALGKDCTVRQVHNGLSRNVGKQLPTHPA